MAGRLPKLISGTALMDLPASITGSRLALIIASRALRDEGCNPTGQRIITSDVDQRQLQMSMSFSKLAITLRVSRVEESRLLDNHSRSTYTTPAGAIRFVPCAAKFSYSLRHDSFIADNAYVA
jgi:hypothetical protein